MTILNQEQIDESLGQVLAGADVEQLKTRYERGGRLVTLEKLLPDDLLTAALSDLTALRETVHRNYVPYQKQGGSVSRHSIDRHGDAIGAVYRSKPLRELLNRVSGERLLDCLPSDPHTYALYVYSEPGDHINWHFDTSFYRGRRYTLLLGLVENESCQLECELHRRDPAREVESASYPMKPGSAVFFDGDAVWHRVSKLAEGDRERVVIAMEFVTDQSMHPWRRLVSNVKDAVAYFGLRDVFARNPGRA